MPLAVPDLFLRQPWWKGYFSVRPIVPSELPAVKRRHIATGAMGNMYGYLLTGLFFVYFGSLIGMTPFHWGIMSGASQWTLLAQPVAARLIQRLGRRKPFWVATALASRVIRYSSIVLAYSLWKLDRPGSVPILIVGVAAANLFGAIAEPSWLSWLADIIPERDHGRFWGRRAAWIAGTSVVALVVAGLLADMAPEAIKPEVVLAVFTVGFLLGVLDILVHGSIPEPAMQPAPPGDLAMAVAQPIKDRSFRPWLLFICCWTFAMTLGQALSDLYIVENLGIKANFLGGSIVMTGIMLTGSLLTGKWSGRLVDGLGIRRVLLIGHLGWGTLPLFWVAATPATALGWLTGSSLVGGTFATAANTAANKLVTRLPPASARTMYIAVSASLASLMGGLGSMVAGAILRFAGRSPLALLGLTLEPFALLFIVSATLRLASAAFLVPRIPRDVRSGGTGPGETG